MVVQMRKRKTRRFVAAIASPRFFKALGDPNRVAIVQKFLDCCCSCTVSETAECCAVDFSVVSRHLAVLRQAGILDAVRRGKEVYYSLRAREVAETLRSVADVFAATAAACKPCASGPRAGKATRRAPAGASSK